MEHYAGIDVSLESSSVCVVDATGRIIREAKVTSDPEVLTAWFKGLGVGLSRIGLEAGPLSQWLYAAMREAGLAVELLETRHVRTGGPQTVARQAERHRTEPAWHVAWVRPEDGQDHPENL
jgi:transposase